MLGLSCGARSSLDEVSANTSGPNQGGSNEGGSNEGGSNEGGSNEGGSNEGGSNEGGSCVGFSFDIAGGVLDLSTDGKKLIAGVSLALNIGQILEADLESGTLTVLAETEQIYDLFVFGDHVYWAQALEDRSSDGSSDGHSIRRVPLGGGPNELVLETGAVAQVAVEADGIYFLEQSLTEGPFRVMRSGPDGVQVLVAGLDFNWREMILGARGVLLAGASSVGVVDRAGGPFVELAPASESRALVEYGEHDYFLDEASPEAEAGISRVPIMGGLRERVLEVEGLELDFAAYEDHYVLGSADADGGSAVWFGSFPIGEPPTLVAQAQVIGSNEAGARVSSVALTESFIVWSEFAYATDSMTIRTACRPELP